MEIMSSPQTVYVNARFLTQPITGVQRFAIELCRALKQQNRDIQLLSPPNIMHVDLAMELGNVTIGTAKGHCWEQFNLPSFLRKKGNPLLLNFCNTAPLFYANNVATIHDLAFWYHPEWFTFAFQRAYRFLIPRIAHKAKLIVTVSQQVKKELRTSWQLSPERIEVVYNGLPSSFRQQNAAHHQQERPYFLAFGGGNPRKNTGRVMEAMQLLGRTDYDLRVVGRAEHNFNAKRNNKPLDFNVIEHHDVSDSELKQLYAAAKALVYPSLYEGFGLPPLEAMSCDCPLLLSNIEVFKELYEGFAIFVDPYSPMSIKEGMVKIIAGEEPSTTAALRNECFKKYSGAAAANKLWKRVDGINTVRNGA
jgi:glycosyltransferase involved in cell wall biosynthesis